MTLFKRKPAFLKGMVSFINYICINVQFMFMEQRGTVKMKLETYQSLLMPAMTSRFGKTQMVRV